MQNIVQQFRGYNIRIVEQDGTHLFILGDLCGALGLSNARVVAKRLDADEVSRAYVIDSMGRQQEAYAVNESGLYAVILRSDKPIAKEFRKWVTNEVLPAIRKTGSYTMPTPEEDTAYVMAVSAKPDFSQLERLAGLTAQAIEYKVAEAKAEVRGEMAAIAQELDGKIGSLPITSVQIRNVKNLVTAIVSRRKELGFANWHWGKVYNEVWQACGVGNLASMTRVQFPKVVEYLTAELTALRVMNPGNMLFREETAVDA